VQEAAHAPHPAIPAAQRVQSHPVPSITAVPSVTGSYANIIVFCVTFASALDDSNPIATNGTYKIYS